MENPLKICGKSLIFSAVLSFSAGDSSGMRASGISLSCGIRGFCGIKQNSFPPARASLMYPPVFSPAAQGSSNSQGKFPDPRHSQPVLLCSLLPGELFLPAVFWWSFDSPLSSLIHFSCLPHGKICHLSFLPTLCQVLFHRPSTGNIPSAQTGL